MSQLSVVLLENVTGLGGAGDIVQVSEGYARNQLFPQGVAALVDAPEGKGMQAKQQAKAKQEQSDLEAAQALAEKLEGAELVISAKVKDEGDEIFGSITAKNIAEELQEQAGIAVTAKQVKLVEPIKIVGTSEVVLELHPDAACEIQITVTPQQDA